MTTVDITTALNKTFREHRRYTGDGLPNPPSGAPLPVGDPSSGVHNPAKSDIRGAFTDVQTVLQTAVDAAETAADEAEEAQEATESAAAQALADIDAAESAAVGLLEGLVNDAVSVSNVPIISTRNAIEVLTIPVGLGAIRTSGYNVMGDGGAAIYYRVAAEPAHGGKVRSADRFLPNGTTDADSGGWWSLASGQQFDVRMFGVNASNSAGENLTPIIGAIAFAIDCGIDRMNIGEGTYALDGAPADIHRVHFIGTGIITGVYRKTSFRPGDYAQFRSAQTFIPERHMQTTLRTRRPIVLATDSLGGLDDFETNSVRNGITPAMIRLYREKFAALGVPVFFRGIGGATFSALNTVWPGALPDWYADDERAWLEYIRDLRPSKLTLSYGMNDGYLYNEGNFTLATLLSIIDKVRGWDFECEIELWTPMVPSLVSQNEQAVGKDNQEGRDAMAGIIRSLAIVGGFGLFDLNRTFNVYRDGRDILDTGWSQPVSISGPVPFLPDVEARDYMLRASFTDIDSDFWTINPFRVPLSNRPSNQAFLSAVGGFLVLDIYADENRQVGSFNTSIAAPAAGSDVEIIFRVIGHSLAVTVNGATVYDGPVLRYGGVFQPQFRYANNAAGMSGAFSLMLGQEKHHHPRFTDGEVYGFYPYDMDGGNQVNHPTPNAYGVMAREVIDAQPWAQSRTLTSDERVLRLLGNGPGAAFDFTTGRVVRVSKPNMASQFDNVADIVDDTAGGSLAYQNNDVGERMGLLVGAGQGAHVTLSDLPFDTDEGTLIVEAQIPSGDSGFFASLVGADTDYITLFTTGSGSNSIVVADDAVEMNVGVSQGTVGKFTTLAVTWKDARFTFCVNGHQFVFQDAAIPTGLTQLRFGRSISSVTNAIVVRRAALIPEHLSDDRLMARTLRFG